MRFTSVAGARRLFAWWEMWKSPAVTTDTFSRGPVARRALENARRVCVPGL
jgi:hypothetical protein